MALEQGITFALLGADGSRVVFGANNAARLDPDHIGFIDPENGIAGLLDGGEQRGGGGNRPGQDGGYDIPTVAARRTGTIKGALSAYEPTTQVLQASRLSRASRTDLGDAVLIWQPTGSPGARMIRLRRRTAPTYEGRARKTFVVAFETRDAYALSLQEDTLAVNALAAPSEVGTPDPVPDPAVSPSTALVAANVVNAGDAPTWPRFRIDGPVTNPEIVNFTTGQRIRLVADLAAGQYVDVLPESGVILLNGTLKRPRFIDTTVSTWFRLRPGSNVIRLVAPSYAGNPVLTTYWRAAFE